MSDSEEDSDQQNSKNIPTSSASHEDDGQQINKKKINGANKNPNEENCPDRSSNGDGGGSHDKFKHMRKSQKPKTSAALNVINSTETILPQPNSSHTEYFEPQSSSLNHNSRMNRHSGSSSTSTDNSNAAYDETMQSAASNGNKSPKKRHCDEEPENAFNPHIEMAAAVPSTSSSTLSLSAASSSSSSSYNLQKPEMENGDYNAQVPCSNFSSSSPLKKRKISLNDYIHIRRNSNNLAEMEENNNETNNNDIFGLVGDHFLNGNAGGGEDYNHNQEQQNTTPQRPTNLNNSSSNMSMFLNNSNMNSSYLFTPDSGVSLNNSLTTPSTIEHNDEAEIASTSRYIMSHRLSPCLEEEDTHNADNECPADVNSMENGEDEGVVTLKIQRYQQKLSRYEQKLARVRRNYRKQFVDDSESE